MALTLEPEVAKQFDPNLKEAQETEPSVRLATALCLQLKEVVHALNGIERELREARTRK